MCRAAEIWEENEAREEKRREEGRKNRHRASRMHNEVKRTLQYLPVFKASLKSLEDRKTLETKLLNRITKQNLKHPIRYRDEAELGFMSWDGMCFESSNLGFSPKFQDQEWWKTEPPPLTWIGNSDYQKYFCPNSSPHLMLHCANPHSSGPQLGL